MAVSLSGIRVLLVKVVAAPAESRQLLSQRLHSIFVLKDHILDRDSIKPLVKKGRDLPAPFAAQFCQRVARLAVKVGDVQRVFR